MRIMGNWWIGSLLFFLSVGMATTKAKIGEDVATSGPDLGQECEPKGPVCRGTVKNPGRLAYSKGVLEIGQKQENFKDPETGDQVINSVLRSVKRRCAVKSGSKHTCCLATEESCAGSLIGACCHDTSVCFNSTKKCCYPVGSKGACIYGYLKDSGKISPRGYHGCCPGLECRVVDGNPKCLQPCPKLSEKCNPDGVLCCLADRKANGTEELDETQVFKSVIRRCAKIAGQFTCCLAAGQYCGPGKRNKDGICCPDISTCDEETNKCCYPKGSKGKCYVGEVVVGGRVTGKKAVGCCPGLKCVGGSCQ